MKDAEMYSFQRWLRLLLIGYIKFSHRVHAVGLSQRDVQSESPSFTSNRTDCPKAPIMASVTSATTNRPVQCEEFAKASSRPLPYDPTRSFLPNGSDASQEPFADQCMLWNPWCSGNKNQALEVFFQKTRYIVARYVAPGNNPYCLQNAMDYHTYRWIRGWMRSPQCTSSAAVWSSKRPSTYVRTPYDDQAPCCGTCHLYGTNVDIFYWPEPASDNSCMSIVGASVSALDAGATKTTYLSDCTPTSSATFWGCTKKASPPGEASVITTAMLRTTGDLTWKQWVVNPWQTPDCIDLPTPRSSLSTFSWIVKTQGPLQNRSTSLHLFPNITKAAEAPAATAVFEGTTLYDVSIPDWSSSY